MSELLSAERRRAMLRSAMGPTMAAALADPAVLEIMVNPDGALGIDILGEGRVDTGVKLDPAQVERIIRLVASHARAEVHASAPIISAELPPHGEGAGERTEEEERERPEESDPAKRCRRPRQLEHDPALGGHLDQRANRRYCLAGDEHPVVRDEQWRVHLRISRLGSHGNSLR